MNKKAALELSINAIVIVILAMTLLGLGLGFVRGMFSQITSISDDTFEKMGEQLNTDLQTSDKPLLFSKTRMTIERGGNALEGLGVKNEGDTALQYGIRISTFNCPADWKVAGVCKPTVDWFEYFKGDMQYDMKAADTGINKVIVKVPKAAKTGLYLLKIIAYEGVWDETNNACLNDYDLTTNPTGCSTIGQTELFLTVG